MGFVSLKVQDFSPLGDFLLQLRYTVHLLCCLCVLKKTVNHDTSPLTHTPSRGHWSLGAVLIKDVSNRLTPCHQDA